MRRSTVITLLFCGLCLLAAACTSADRTSTDGPGAVKPEARAAAAGAQDQEAQGEPPSGEIQERAAPRMPRAPDAGFMAPAPGTAPQHVPPPRLMMPGVPAPPPVPAPNNVAFEPGEFALATVLRGTYLTAVNGGGLIHDALHTDATQIRSWERFKLAVFGDINHPQYAIQTTNGNYLTAVNGGGLTTDAVHTDATQLRSWESFRLYEQQDSSRYAIQTTDSHYLTAVGGGGKNLDALHTDATQVGSWEQWRLVKLGDLGSLGTYCILTANGYFLSANGGGGQIKNAMSVSRVNMMGPTGSWEQFKLWGEFVGGPEGWYSIQTSNGINVVTAVGGGGPVQPPTPDILQTNRDKTQVQAWERFRFVYQGDGTYAIQTVSGYNLTVHGVGIFTTDRSVIGPGEKFTLIRCAVSS